MSHWILIIAVFIMEPDGNSFRVSEYKDPVVYSSYYECAMAANDEIPPSVFNMVPGEIAIAARFQCVQEFPV